MATTPPSAALRALSLELKKIKDEPVEGFTVTLPSEANLFEWEVAIFGPPETLYQGGYFKARMEFPHDYPYSPPTFKFVTKMWHPNIYEQTGDVCISILHPPIDDPQSGELPSERWNPTQSVRFIVVYRGAEGDLKHSDKLVKYLLRNLTRKFDRLNVTILLSVISLLNEPNTFSPANVDASVMYRRYKETKGEDSEYKDIIRKQVTRTKDEAEKDGVTVPLTLQEYCIKPKTQTPSHSSQDLTDWDDDYADDGDYEEDEEEDGCYIDDEDDSGNGEL